MLSSDREVKINSLIASGMLGVTLIAGAVLAGTPVNADEEESVVSNVSVTVTTSCTFQGIVNTAHTANIENGTVQGNIGSTTLKAFCNDNGGFSIHAIGYTDEEYGKTVLSSQVIGDSVDIATGTGTSGTSSWAMKLATDSSATYPVELDNGFGSYSAVPTTYAQVAHRNGSTDVGTSATGALLTTTYQVYVASDQPADTYVGKVKYTMVHPSTEVPLQPQTTAAGKICYYPNTSAYEGTMGCQTISTTATSATLFASNFSRDGYGFAGWSDAFDYATNSSANFYGPNEDITFTAGQYTGNNDGLSLYAVWVKSAGSLQDSNKVTELCGVNGTGGTLTAATYSDEGDSDESTWSITAGLSSISALTDNRDNQTYAIAKLSDGKCWMIENLRLADTHQEGTNTVATTLTTTNTNNPLNDGTNVTLKHNYTDTTTYNTLSATSSVAYDADTAPDGWCTSATAACYDQSRLRTDNTASRATYASSDTMSTSANLYSYGNYYNWYSATAGNGTYSKSSGNTAGDLCPAGWHLPTGTGSGEFGLLSNSLGGYQSNGVAQTMSSSTSPTHTIMKQRIRHFPNNFVYSGYVNGSSVGSRGSYGYYWSSAAYSSNGAYYMYFNSSYVRPGTDGSSKYTGRAVRCLAQ